MQQVEILHLSNFVKFYLFISMSTIAQSQRGEQYGVELNHSLSLWGCHELKKKLAE